MAAVAVIARLVQIQYLEPDRYVALGDDQRFVSRELPAARGSILDRGGQVLAVSVDRPTLFADPRLVTDPAGYAEVLAPVLRQDPAVLHDRLRAGVVEGKAFVYLARQVDPPVAEAALELGLAGVGSYDEPWRAYPAGAVAGAVLGGVDPDHVGVAGLEKTYDEALEGTPGAISFEQAEGGELIPVGRTAVEPARPGDDLVLTLDREIQWLTEEVLARAVRDNDARGGMAVLLASDTGEVLALASVDAGDGVVRPSSYPQEVVDAFEPGSVSKVFTVAAALEEGLVTPGTAFDVDTAVTVHDAQITDVHSPGRRMMSVAEIVQESSNVGTVQVAQSVGADRLDHYLRRFGFGRRTGAGGEPVVPYESAGVLPAVENWSGTSLATISYGQGISVTGLQMAAAYNVIANDGVYVSPVLVQGADSDRRRVVSSATAAALRDILTGVVHAGGTGVRAQVPGFLVAGKTGTARKPDPENRGYLEGTWVSTFAGFAPADDPVVTAVVVVDDPKPEYYGGLVAAPLFSELAGYALRTLRVPPTDPVAIEAAEAGADADGG